MNNGHYFEIYRNHAGLWFWRLKRGDGGLMMSSEPYVGQAQALEAAALLKLHASDATIR